MFVGIPLGIFVVYRVYSRQGCERGVLRPRGRFRGGSLPALAGSAVILLALPVFAIAGWSLRGWALAAVLWIAGQLLTLLLTRVRNDPDNVAGQAVVGIGTSFQSHGGGHPARRRHGCEPERSGWLPRCSTPARTRSSWPSRSVAYFAQQPTRGRAT